MAGARDSPDVNSTDPHATDPPLLENNSEFRSYKTSRFEYPDIRVFFRQHAKARELPAPLPLLVCIPGLGGSVAQFHPLLSSLVDLAPCLAIDYPGGGRSRYAVTSWDAYTPEALLELLETVIEDYRDTDAGQSVVLIGHSMGTALAARLANKKASHTTRLADHVVGLVAICPTSGPWGESTSTVLRRLLWVPGWIFALWRAWDGMGGPQSPSVARFVGEGAEPKLKLLQYRFNQQSRTPVWRRMAYGALPVYQDGKPIGGIPGLDTWASLDIPVYLIAGEKDHLTPPKEVHKIVEAMGLASNGAGTEATEQPGLQSAEAAATVSLSLRPQDHMPDGSDGLKNGDLDGKSVDQTDILDDPHDDPSTPLESESPGSLGSPVPLPSQPQHPLKVVQSIVIPAPANHALLYMPRSARALAGLISDFLAINITGRLSLAWQLQYLSREGKWDVKNLIKWKSVAPVSELIGPQGKPIFRAMKTLREADDGHCPTAFVEQWGSVVKDVIDISKDQPVYDPRGLERGGVHYHKFPTVSKIPPHAHEVEAFIDLVDKLRDAQKERGVAEAWEDAERCVIGVHCHYGFNRTGYFIVCYLVERCGFALSDAIEAFARARPNGIRHSHFLDRLYVRYNIDEARGW
ncbi:mRNA-capping enzyme [Tolypocladium ophioglossoides CBS 100239]|uniref:mRNA-capping enzyme n=1 Tax=Tolypocladium ophioglossoides (strain CBS 100239) TaxID=1163406 RepID=A0A0L0NAT6_TOLOC|nr:mRNA-capping enzyme [Tolypocladium ophioglossoides CBS 100239]